jgi:chorismate--pyruvate lyase
MIASRPADTWRRSLSRCAANTACIACLCDRGSLTARIQAKGRFTVRVLRQGLALPTRDEAAALGIAADTNVWVREVALSCDAQVVVLAHTVLPRQPRGPLTRWLARLGSRSLGSLLFSHAGFRRGEMHFKRLDARHPLFQPACATLGAQAKTLWARRSLFAFGRQSVLVTEVFSPAWYNKTTFSLASDLTTLCNAGNDSMQERSPIVRK